MLPFVRLSKSLVPVGWLLILPPSCGELNVPVDCGLKLPLLTNGFPIVPVELDRPEVASKLLLLAYPDPLSMTIVNELIVHDKWYALAK